MSSNHRQKPPLSPLTHHEILLIVEPFTRRGRQLDLAASDRLARRLVFKPVAHTTDEHSRTCWRETLALEDTGSGSWRLHRALTLDDGLLPTLQADLEAQGTVPGDLLTLVDAVPPQRQVAASAGAVIASSHSVAPGAGADMPSLRLTSASARIGELTFTMKVPRVSGMPAEIDLLAPAPDALDLPEDLLAVLGLDWARLCRYSQGWTGSLQLRKHEPERSRDAQAKLDRTVQHLASILAQPPGHFHDRFGTERWGVVLRRSIPLLVSIGLIAAAAAVPILDLPEGSVFRMLIFNAPPLLMVAFFCMREMPRIEIPPWPRRSRSPAWRQPAVTPQNAPVAAR
jgi:hypothetical protein